MRFACTMPEDLLLVQSGGIKLSMPGEDGREILIDYRGEGSCVGELSLIQDAPATMNAHTVEDTFVIRLPGAVFKDLLRTQPLIAEYFLRSFSSTYLSQAFSDINRRTSLQTDSGLHFFGTENITGTCFRGNGNQYSTCCLENDATWSGFLACP